MIVSAAFTGSVKAWLTELFRLTLKVTGPEVGGVPVSRPAEDRVSQAGRPVADQLYVPVPPDPANVNV